MRQKHSTQSGFSLIETTIAMLLLMIALVGVAGVFSYVVRYNSGAGDRAMALAVAQQQMERLRNEPFTSSALNATASGGTKTTVTHASRPYSVNVIIANTTATRKTITVEVTPNRSMSLWAQTTIRLVTQRAAFTVNSTRI